MSIKSPPIVPPHTLFNNSIDHIVLYITAAFPSSTAKKLTIKHKRSQKEERIEKGKRQGKLVTVSTQSRTGGGGIFLASLPKQTGTPVLFDRGHLHAADAEWSLKDLSF